MTHKVNHNGELFELQKAFTEHLRNPDTTPVPLGLDERRMGIYSSLIFNNVSALLSDFFPVIKSILSDDDWQTMVRDFFITYQSQTPYFIELSGEFVQYLSQSQMISHLPDFIVELAHYEWVELALFTMNEERPDETLSESELANEPVALSPLAQPLAYRYPVHRIQPDFIPASAGDELTYLMVLRNLQDSVKFYELQPLAYMLLHEIEENPGVIVTDLLENWALENKIDNKSEFVSNGLGLLTSFNEQRIFVKG